MNDVDEVAGFRYYCSEECQENDSKVQKKCRATNSEETDEPGCGRYVTEDNPLADCFRDCGKMKFCSDCAEGKGISVDDPSGEDPWWWCSKECKRLDDKDYPDEEYHKYDKADPKPGEDNAGGDDDDEGPQTKKPDGTQCENVKCKHTFNNSTRKRAQCHNPNCLKNRDFCKPCTITKSDPENGYWLRKPDRWFCDEDCIDVIEKPLEAASAVADAAAEEANQRGIDEIRRRREAATARAKEEAQKATKPKETAAVTKAAEEEATKADNDDDDARKLAAAAAFKRDEEKAKKKRTDAVKLAKAGMLPRTRK